jgi:hypothetical protein
MVLDKFKINDCTVIIEFDSGGPIGGDYNVL